MATPKAAPKQVAAKEAPRAVTPVSAPDSWGPFREYTFITTAFGEYGVPANHILTFEMKKVRNLKTNEVEDRPMPQYERVLLTD